MKIAIIGTGNVGGALAKQWATAGHDIFLGVRDMASFKGQALLNNPRTVALSIAEAVRQSEVILVASPPQVAEQLAETFGDVRAKVIIDATNAVRTKPAHYPTAYHAFEALTEAQVVKCFNSTGFENMENPKYGDTQLDMFMAGSSADAKAIARELSAAAGFANCYDFGGTDRVELLEKFALSWINLAIFQGLGRDIGFKVVFRP